MGGQLGTVMKALVNLMVCYCPPYSNAFKVVVSCLRKSFQV